MWCLLFKQKEHYTNTVKCSVSTLCLHIQFYITFICESIKTFITLENNLTEKLALNTICSRRLFV